MQRNPAVIDGGGVAGLEAGRFSAILQCPIQVTFGIPRNGPVIEAGGGFDLCEAQDGFKKKERHHSYTYTKHPF